MEVSILKHQRGIPALESLLTDKLPSPKKG